MKEKIEKLISEANQNFKETISVPKSEITDENGFMGSSNLSEESSTKGPGSGLIYLGNFLGGNLTFTITGRKYGTATKEVHVVPARTGKWLYSWDTGNEEIVIIHTDYRNDTATYSPFYGCAHVWFLKCR